MHSKIVVDSIPKVAELGLKYCNYIFRGQPKRFGVPVPKIYRKRYCSLCEINLLKYFQRYAPAFSASLPAEDDYLHWLFLMQHYGFPTRLLDWSESILKATFFAVSDEDFMDEDAEIWIVNPTGLNSLGRWTWPHIHGDSKWLDFYLAEPYLLNEADQKRLKDSMYMDEAKLLWPIAIRPPMQRSRLVAQDSVFTLHPQYRESLPKEIYPEPAHIDVIMIPKEHKRDIFVQLGLMGITYKTLFPELDSIAKDLYSSILLNSPLYNELCSKNQESKPLID
jgi:hypothetical protein